MQNCQIYSTYLVLIEIKRIRIAELLFWRHLDKMNFVIYILSVGGAFNTPPSWLSWGKYASFFFYGLQALIALEFKDAPPIK